MNDPSSCDDGGVVPHNVVGFLGHLARDAAGNTLAMMAAFMIPLALLAGSAVDISRLYLVKARLQQACDAGVLAGRKVMTVTSGTTLDDPAAAGTPAADAATAFFQSNFPTGWMGTTGRSFIAGRTNDGQVTGTATVTTPMALMGMFGFGDTTQSVNCMARLDIGDSDIMFVLDVTGSMGCASSSGCSTTKTWTRADGTTGYYIEEQTGSKISSLRNAVKLFRTTLESSKPAAAHIRYGFVPYSSSVNVGALITEKSPDYIVDSASYPSREVATDLSSGTLPTGSNSANYSVQRGQYNQGDFNYGSSSTVTATTVSLTSPNNNKEGCLAKETRKGSDGNSYAIGTWPTSGTLSREYPVWSSGTCYIYKWTVKPLWRYKQVNQNVSEFKNFSWIDDPTKISSATTKWQGCIEERATNVSTTTTTYDVDDLPADLDPDLIPDSPATRWRPLWPDVVYYRAGAAAATDYGGSNSSASSDVSSTGAATNYSNLLVSTTGSLGPTTQYYGCSAPAKRLAEMSAADFNDYLGTATTGDFRPFGHTYHDVGMIWGLRLISPDGIWKDDTAAWPGNNPPNRYIVFMTDGLMDPDPNAYHLYGLNKFEARAAAANTSDGNLATIHSARFQAVCDAAKAKNITVFVVAFDVGSTVPLALDRCATPGYAYAATNSTTLENAFKTIALQIARLRLSQ